MESKDQSFRSFTYEKELERAKWFKDDLEQSDSEWSEVHQSPRSTYWLKTFPEEEVALKILFKFESAMPAKTFLRMLEERETRKNWDDSFVEHETLETFPDNGGCVTYMRALTSWPLADRGFVLFIPPIKEVDWYGKKAYFLIEKNAWHHSKPPRDGVVRATNGGNFFIVTPDEKDPESACKVFGLTNNNFNGWVPSGSNVFMKMLVSKAVPRSFDKLHASMLKGYKDFFQNSRD